MKTKTQFLAYVATMLWDVTIAWPVILIIRAFWGKNLRWETPPMPNPGGPVLTCELRADSWPARTWYVQRRERDGTPRTWGATTLGHAIFYGVDQRPDKGWNGIQEHEHVHVEQFEGIAIAGLVGALWTFICVAALGHVVAAVLIALPIWWLSYVVWGAGNWAVAAMRGENFYLGSSHEESAYAQQRAYEEGRRD